MSILNKLFGGNFKKNPTSTYQVACYNANGKLIDKLSADEFGYNSLGLVDELARSAITNIVNNKLGVSESVVKKVEKNGQMFFSQMLGLYIATYVYMLTDFNSKKLSDNLISIEQVKSEIDTGINRGAKLWFGVERSKDRQFEYQSFQFSRDTIAKELLLWHKSAFIENNASISNPLSIILNSSANINNYFVDATSLDLYSLEIEIGLDIKELLPILNESVKLWID